MGPVTIIIGGRSIVDRLAVIEGKLDRLLAGVRRVERQEAHSMAIGQDILDAVTAQTTLIDSLVALIDGWIAAGNLTPEQGEAILAQIADGKAAIEAAILAHTPQAP